MTALAATGELLATVDLAPGTPEREAAFLAADATLSAARVLRGTTRCRVGLYNPYTAEISLGAVPATAVFSDHAPLAFPTEGMHSRLDEDTDQLVTEDRTLPRYEATLASTSRALLAHQG